MSPYERGMVNGTGFNAVMDQEIAKKRYRIIGGRKYLYFYNPMWNLLGDITSGPPGTYYYRATPSYFWYTFDQVLIRPDLLSYFDISNLEIITIDGDTPFLTTQGRPNKKISDHLPLLFRLDL